ncbi:MAG: thiamine phosphate synthase [Vicinamibacterales bacterium]
MVPPEPILVLVTDRHRLAAALGAPAGQALALVEAQACGAVAGGVSILHVREPDLGAGDLLALTGALLTAARGTDTRVVVNDRLDVALAAGADGVHLRERSVASHDARRLLGAGRLVGRSVHDGAGVANAGPVDYLVAGTVFETVSKPGLAAPLGLDGLRALVQAAGARPVVAIGGLTAANIGLAFGAGARGGAAIGAFIPGRQARRRLAPAVKKLVETLRNGLNSSGTLP